MMYVDGDGLCLLLLVGMVIFIIGVTVGACGMQKQYEEDETL